MNKILVILSLIAISCSNNASQVEANAKDEDEHEQHEMATTRDSTTLQLNDGAKWKADDATRKNVAAIVKVITGSSNTGEKNRTLFTRQFRAKVDTLLQQCKMKGPDHDALHAWLEQVLQDLKKVERADKDEYQTSYARLKTDVERFYIFFE